jgi:hypothetical protein
MFLFSVDRVASGRTLCEAGLRGMRPGGGVLSKHI